MSHSDKSAAVTASGSGSSPRRKAISMSGSANVFMSQPLQSWIPDSRNSGVNESPGLRAPRDAPRPGGTQVGTCGTCAPVKPLVTGFGVCSRARRAIIGRHVPHVSHVVISTGYRISSSSNMSPSATLIPLYPRPRMPWRFLIASRRFSACVPVAAPRHGSITRPPHLRLR